VAVVRSLACVDEVLVFDDDTPRRRYAPCAPNCS
jgi:bifunctional ADP-heptose synthase (sugar kinase/adenylyltransferase)